MFKSPEADTGALAVWARSVAVTVGADPGRRAQAPPPEFGRAVPGDLVWMPGHIGFWAGPGMMLDSPTEGKSIAIRPIWSDYYVVFRVGIN